ncbi:hypothetical protein HKX48_000901, partial [Thoreauomyces humboldtii]
EVHLSKDCRAQPKSGNLITFFQFLIVALEGLYSHLRWERLSIAPAFSMPVGLQPRIVPLTHWCKTVAIFWTVSVLNNFALGFRISVPLHIIFRSLGLVVSLGVGWAIFGKRFSRSQVLGVILVSAGVIAATYASSTPTSQPASTAATTTPPLYEWLTGLLILTVALFLSAFLGQLQQTTYSRYGPAWREGLFYTHCLGMPAFLLFSSDLISQWKAYGESPSLSFAGWKIPSMFLFLVGNTLTQYVCISGVHRLSSMASAVSLNLMLSVRKFASLLISILLFDNKFTLGHWFGTIAVLAGTMIYSTASGPSPRSATIDHGGGKEDDERTHSIESPVSPVERRRGRESREGRL